MEQMPLEDLNICPVLVWYVHTCVEQVHKKVDQANPLGDFLYMTAIGLHCITKVREIMQDITAII